MIERLKKGLYQFHQFTYKKNEKLYLDLKNTQHPHTLFIACSDSRVSPTMLTDSEPGEVFIIRNIANTVPTFEKSKYDLTTVSAIEYAVEVLEVKQIVICGHSNCGGCAAALAGTEKLSNLPFTKEYLKPLETVREIIEEQYNHMKENVKAELMEKVNVVEQLKHLKEYPLIEQRMRSGTLEIEGWHYDIGSGMVLVYDEKVKDFIEVVD